MNIMNPAVELTTYLVGLAHPTGDSTPVHPGVRGAPIFSWGSLSPRRAWTQPPDCLNPAPRSWLEAWNPFAQVNLTGRKYE